MPECDPSAPDPAGQVFLVEDDAAVRASLALLLQLHGYKTREFASAEDFLVASPRLERPACVLVDVRLPGMSGIALQARMAHDRRSPPVLLMTAQGSEALARSALLQGAVDFLEKPIDENDLLNAVAAGLRRDIEHITRDRERDAVEARVGTLTPQEIALFEGITNGRQAREIAEEFGVAIDVLEQQKVRLMKKLEIGRIADLFRLRFRLAEILASRTRPH
jgi:FixJ family two-component response regulator